MVTASRQPVLVTGASGFIGGQLVRRLIERGCRVSCLVRATIRTTNLFDVRLAGAELLKGDVTDRGSLARALEQSEATTVFHVAGVVRRREQNNGKLDEPQDQHAGWSPPDQAGVRADHARQTAKMTAWTHTATTEA